jgi:hypothetical protein
MLPGPTRSSHAEQTTGQAPTQSLTPTRPRLISERLTPRRPTRGRSCDAERGTARRAGALPGRRRGPRRCRAGSNPAPGGRRRSGPRHGRDGPPTGTGAGVCTWRTSDGGRAPGRCSHSYVEAEPPFRTSGRRESLCTVRRWLSRASCRTSRRRNARALARWPPRPLRSHRQRLPRAPSQSRASRRRGLCCVPARLWGARRGLVRPARGWQASGLDEADVTWPAAAAEVLHEGRPAGDHFSGSERVGPRIGRSRALNRP